MIEYPLIDDTSEERRAALMISRTSGGLTTEIVEAQIAARRELLTQIAAGLDTPVCPELTNANPSAPHTVLLEAISWAISQQAYRFNRIPEQNLIAFANLFGIERRPATRATTILEFTVDPPAGTDVVVPAGTEISDATGTYIFTTTAALTIVYGNPSGTVQAERSITGHTLLSANVLTELVDVPAYVSSVRNPSAIDAGTEIEAVQATLERVRQYMRRGERIVTVMDLEEAIADEALDGNGVVRVFPFIRNGEFTTGELLVGHTTAVVMTTAGDPIDATMRDRCSALAEQCVGNQFTYIVDPVFINFDIEATIRVRTGSPEGSVLTNVEKNLRAFYAAARENFGRPILRSEIITVIEGTAGVDRIVAVYDPTADRTAPTPIIAAPLADSFLQEFQVPRLVTVTLHVG
ncbi:MAG TPA: baseplate J/gp47 family protein [Pyrinomonadaceae bacterium]|nr:baseplate J/gp47 family protein [Pyrinomonadaceae bacterium]